MRQSLFRVLGLIIVVVLVFGIYRLLTVQPLEPAAFFTRPGQPAPLLIADTGQSRQAPPYTLAALQAAQQAGADGFWLPVQLTKDGELVVLADPDLALVSERQGRASDLTLAELRGLDAGYRFDPDASRAYPWRGQGLRILTLQEALAAFPTLRAVVALPALEPGAASSAALAAVLRASQAADAAGRLLVAVDDDRVAEELRGRAPELATAYTSQERDRFLATQRLRLTPFYRPVAPALLLHASQVSRDLLAAAGKQGVNVMAWAGPAGDQDGEALARLATAGLDGVIVQDLDALAQWR